MGPGALRWNFSKLIRAGYSGAEASLLADIYAKAGAAGRHAVSYMATHDVQIYSTHNMIPSNGAQWGTNGNIYVNSNLYGDISNLSASDPLYAIVAGLVAHEARHLEQGAVVARSVYGEHDAWKIGYDVGIAMGQAQPPSGSAVDIVLRRPLSHDEDDLKEIQLEMTVAYPGYPILVYPLNPSPAFSKVMDFLDPALTGVQLIYGWTQGY